MSLRFAILHHTGVAAPHFDLLFEMEPGELLTTFRCPAWPPAPGDVWEELPEHRLIYLDYEGPISGDRGAVRRIEAGTIRHVVLSADPPMLALALEGMRTNQVSIAHHLEPGIESQTRWIVQTVEDATTSSAADSQ